MMPRLYEWMSVGSLSLEGEVDEGEERDGAITR